MKKEFSLYLDLVRFLAALLVYVWHSNNRNIISDILPMSQYGHSAVIVFFVLSGFVIAYVADTKEKTLRDYSISRLARIYSVAPAALILALVLDQIGLVLDPGMYDGSTTHDHYLLRMVTSLLFLNEVWGISITSYSNVPYWSLNYEVWYYVSFAMVAFAAGRTRVLLLLGLALLLGPKVVLLAPIWWLGVWLHRHPPRGLGEPSGWGLFLGSILLIYLFHLYEVDEIWTQWLKAQIGEHWWTQLTFSRRFLSDYVLGALIAMNFVGFRLISHRFARPFAVAGGTIRFLAGFTFSLYLFHQPLIFFFAALIQGDNQGPWFYTQVTVAVMLSILLLGSVTEQRKHFYRRLAGRAVDLFLRVKGAWYRRLAVSSQ